VWALFFHEQLQHVVLECDPNKPLGDVAAAAAEAQFGRLRFISEA
jgi:hypothetical protein